MRVPSRLSAPRSPYFLGCGWKEKRRVSSRCIARGCKLGEDRAGGAQITLCSQCSQAAPGQSFVCEHTRSIKGVVREHYRPVCTLLCFHSSFLNCLTTRGLNADGGETACLLLSWRCSGSLAPLTREEHPSTAPSRSSQTGAGARCGAVVACSRECASCSPLHSTAACRARVSRRVRTALHIRAQRTVRGVESGACAA